MGIGFVVPGFTPNASRIHPRRFICDTFADRPIIGLLAGDTAEIDSTGAKYQWTGGSWIDITLHAPTQEAVGRDLTSEDNGGTLVCTSSSPETFVLLDDLVPGFHCAIIQGGTGKVTVSAQTTATVFNRSGEYSTAGQGAAIAIINKDTDAYIVGGDTGA